MEGAGAGDFGSERYQSGIPIGPSKHEEAENSTHRHST